MGTEPQIQVQNHNPPAIEGSRRHGPDSRRWRPAKL